MDVPEIKQFSDLPFHLVTDILLKLPLETLLRCRYVCKAWDGFFTNPELAELQLAASPIHFGRGVKVDGKLQAQTLDFTPRLLDLPDDDTYWCVNSSNGLLCLVGRCDGSISVCNPLLGESVSIPEPLNYKGGRRSEAIGFSAKDGLYKVLVAYKLKEEDKEDEDEGDKEVEDDGDKEDVEEEDKDCGYGFEIYTLGTREWRAIDTVEGCKPWHGNGMDFNTFLHGSLHWVSVGLSSDGGSRVRSLWSFNFETEKFQRLALPEAGDNCSIRNYTEIKGEDGNLYVQIGIMNGRLWLCFCSELQYVYDIWVMKEYGMKESWTQIPSSPFKTYCYPGHGVPYPILLYSFSHKDVLITDEEDPEKSHSIHVEKVLVADKFGNLICYNVNAPKTKKRVVEFNRRSSHTYDFFCVTSYVPSFVSLQDVAKGEEVKVSRITYEAAQ